MKYDIIGDIHGEAGKLDRLLAKLGYETSNDSWFHKERMAIFVGDFIDLGPEQLRTVCTVKRMVEGGRALAVMGNHEFNAIAWHTPDPQKAGEYLRPRFSQKWGDKNREMHKAFLSEVESNPAKHSEIIDWFLNLPLWLDLAEIRVVHACWHQRWMDWLSPQLGQGNRLTRDLMVEASREPRNSEEKDDENPSVFKAVEALTKGIEIELPEGHDFEDKYGNRRTRVRVKWWDLKAETYQSAAMLTQSECDLLPNSSIPTSARIGIGNKPTFFGHYWMTGTPKLQSQQAACVDYSAGKGGRLVAYRFDGESHLSVEKFEYVD